MRDIEIQKISQPESSQTKVAQELSTVDRQDGLDRFQFHNNRLIYQEIDTVAVLDAYGTVAYGNADLVLYAKLPP